MCVLGNQKRSKQKKNEREREGEIDYVKLTKKKLPTVTRQ